MNLLYSFLRQWYFKGWWTQRSLPQNSKTRTCASSLTGTPERKETATFRFRFWNQLSAPWWSVLSFYLLFSALSRRYVIFNDSLLVESPLDWCNSRWGTYDFRPSPSSSNFLNRPLPPTWVFLAQLRQLNPCLLAVLMPRRRKSSVTVKTCANSRPRDAREPAVERSWRRPYPLALVKRKMNSSWSVSLPRLPQVKKIKTKLLLFSGCFAILWCVCPAYELRSWPIGKKKNLELLKSSLMYCVLKIISFDPFQSFDDP